MTVQRIIQESVNKNPLGMKEALEEELRARVSLALEAKISETFEKDLDEEVEDLEEISQEKLRDYHAKAGVDRQKARATVEKGMKAKNFTPSSVQKTSDAYKRFIKRGKGMTAAANKMREDLDEITRTAMKRPVTYTGADGHSHTKLMPVKRVEKTAGGQDKIQEK